MARKTSQVTVEVEVVVFEIPVHPRKPSYSTVNRIAYEGEGVQVLLAAQNALMSEMWQIPKHLQT